MVSRRHLAAARAQVANATRRGVLPLAVAAIAYAFAAPYYLRHNPLNADESFYAYAAFQALSGLLPYADFAYTQAPLLPYVNGAVLELAGYSLENLRAVGVSAGALGLAALVCALRDRFGSWAPGSFAVLALVSNPTWVSFQALGKTYAVAGAALVIAAAALVARGAFTTRLAVAAVFGALAVGCRATCASSVALLALCFVAQARTRRERALALAFPAITMAFALVPFVARDWEAARFFLYEYHASSSLQRALVFEDLVSWLHHAGGPLALLALGTALVHRPWSRRGRVGGLLVAAWGGLVTPLFAGTPYGEYAVPFLPLAALAGSLALWSASPGPAARQRLGRGLWLLPAFSLVTGRPPTDPEDLFRINKLALRIEELAPKGEVLTPIPIVALKAGRPITPGTGMGIFSSFPDAEAARAQRLHSTTLALLTARVAAREPAALVLYKGRHVWNFGWQVPTLARSPSIASHAFYQEIKCQYDPVKRYGSMVLYLRKGPDSPPCPRDAPPDDDAEDDLPEDEAPDEAAPREGKAGSDRIPTGRRPLDE